MRLKVKQGVNVGQNIVHLIKPGLRSRVEPIPQTQEQRMAQDFSKRMQQALSTIFPGGVVIGGLLELSTKGIR